MAHNRISIGLDLTRIFSSAFRFVLHLSRVAFYTVFPTLIFGLAAPYDVLLVFSCIDADLLLFFARSMLLL